MIRLQLTTIDLSRRDLSEYEKRKKLQDAPEPILPIFGLFKPEPKQQPFYQSAKDHNKSFNAIEKNYAPQSSVSNQMMQSYLNQSLLLESSHLGDGDTSSNESSDAPDYIQVSLEASLENTALEPQRQTQPVSPSKDDFHYGGFVESPLWPVAEDVSGRSSPFGMFVPLWSGRELTTCSARGHFYTAKPSTPTLAYQQ